jgi:hypothetical protein
LEVCICILLTPWSRHTTINLRKLLEEVIDDLSPEAHTTVSHSHLQRQITSFTMGFRIATLFKAPEVNPITQKARSIPFFNLVNVYGRVFFFSWFGFFVAFWSWYAFPPLVRHKRSSRCSGID